MSATTPPAVKSRLKELFTAAVESSTEVWVNRPNEDHSLEENVYIGDVEGDREWKNVGRPNPHQREENYSVEVTVEVFREGTDSEGTESRLWAIVEQVEAAVAQDPTLGGLENVTWALVGRFRQTSKGASDGWLCEAVLWVAVTARI